jgi:Ca2+-binding RTX toxin-like protein
MRTRLALAGLTLMGAGLVAPSAQALAAETCQGKRVTISDSDGGYVEGTEGDDVILASDPDGQTTVDALGGDDTICFRNGVVRAGSGHDSVELRPVWADAAILDAEDLDVSGRTDDGSVYLRLQNVGHGSGTVNLDEDDSVELVGEKRVVVDLSDDLMRLDRGAYSLVGRPAVYAVARRVLLTGDGARNRLHVHQRTCRATVHGGRGQDSLEIVSGFLVFEPFSLPKGCARRPTEMFGHRGNDRLQGGRFEDLLVGGPGKDRARGGPGADTCRAEIEKDCP